MDKTASTGERRRYWLGMAALAVILPAAILVHSGETIGEWWRAGPRTPVIVEPYALHGYAGADWRLTRLTRLPGDLPNTAIVLAEFEATIDDPDRLTDNPCTVALTDPEGRRWDPVFLTEQAVRKARPKAAEKPRCGLFNDKARGETVEMAESFIVPANAEGLTLSVALANALPAYLRFR